MHIIKNSNSIPNRLNRCSKYVSEQSASCFGKYRIGRYKLRKVQYVLGR